MFFSGREMKRSMMNMEKRVLAVLCLFVCVAGAFMGKTVVSEAGSKQQAERELYHEMEMEYLKETMEILSESGYSYSGVNLTKVIDEEGRRTYTVRIHNRKIDALNDEKKEELLNELRSVYFADEQCEFHHEFFTAENK